VSGSALALLIAAPSIAVRAIVARPIALRLERPRALRLAPSILLAIPIERRPVPLRFRRTRCRFRLRVKIPALSVLEARAFLVARELVPRAARPPVGVAAGRLSAALDERKTRGFRGLPELAAVEPAQRNVLLRALQLVQRGQQVFAPRRSKRRRHGAGQDHPEGVMPRHIALSAARGAAVFR
jgi:hypothetical protein